MSKSSRIIYTYTDEAPALATQSLLPIIEAFCQTAGISVETKDISLAGRILAGFPEALSESQKQSDDLAVLGDLVKKADANVIKLPNISASIPQLMSAIQELQDQGFKIPDYPQNPSNAEQKEIQERYSKVLGSAVNPVLREGNSDRRVAKPVKEYARKNPHSMGAWSSSSKSRVAHMSENDFFGSEKSYTCPQADEVKIELHSDSGAKVLKDFFPLQEGEVVDASAMSVKALRSFFAREIESVKKEDGVLLSLHMKATMMKVSDPIIFGHCVEVYFKDAFDKYGETLAELGVKASHGLGQIFSKIDQMDDQQKSKEIRQAFDQCLADGPDMAMVNSDKGITNLHVPSDVIIDASMPAAIRSSGKMWGPDGELHDMVALIPDRSYAGVYQQTIEFCREHGAFDPTTMGNIPNVGLMAQKAEEYGSHNKTFEIPEDGVVKVSLKSGEQIFEHSVEKGDIWRMCQTKDAPIKDWVRLAVARAKNSQTPAVFWLNSARAHDAELIKKVEAYLPNHDTSGLDIRILAPEEAAKHSLTRMKKGEDTISVTGNVLRDYLTDLFPILELGTSAKMLSIVPLLAGGGLFETGAGGSAPKHVEQFVEEGHLRWDSLGEFLALGVSLEDLAEKSGNAKAKVLSDTLSDAIGGILENGKSPLRKVGQLDNRGSHFYLAMYWAQALARQSADSELKAKFEGLASQLSGQEAKIVEELNQAQGRSVDIGGYFHPDFEKVRKAMRPSETFNHALASL